MESKESSVQTVFISLAPLSELIEQSEISTNASLSGQRLVTGSGSKPSEHATSITSSNGRPVVLSTPVSYTHLRAHET